MKKELYEDLQIEVIAFDSEDIITTSDPITYPPTDDPNDLPIF